MFWSVDSLRGPSAYRANTLHAARQANPVNHFKLPLQTRQRGIVLAFLGLTVSSVMFAAPGLWAAFFSGPTCGESGPSANSPSQRRIALVDQLSLDDPNPDFLHSINESARNSGYTLDYYLPSAASLDSFFRLGTMGYSMIILRTHGVTFSLDGRSYIVTSNPYDAYTRVGDQLKDRLGVVDVNGRKYFAITPKGIEDICGSFAKTTILAMFCSGGQWTSLARAFIDKGAQAYVGWNSTVTVAHTDFAFGRLVGLLLNGDSVSAAVRDVMRVNGPDPVYGAQLTFYQN